MQYIFTLFLISFLLPVTGQITQTHRIEIPFQYSEENYLITSAGRQGLILFRESKERVKKKQTWQILILDTDLKEKFNTNTEIDYKYSIMGYEYSRGYFYLLFKNDNTSESELLLIKTSIESGEIASYKITGVTMDVSHLLINRESIALGGYVNYGPAFVIFDYVNDKIKVVPGFFNNKSKVLDFNYDQAHRSYNVLMRQQNTFKHHEIVLKSFDNHGRILIDEKYEFDKNRRPLNGRLIIGNNHKIIVSGTYSGNHSYYSQGYYFGSLSPGKSLSMKYTGFAEINHFFDYMSERRAFRIKSKIADTRDNDKPYEFKTQVYVHELREQAGEFLVVSELYKPEFKRTSAFGTYGTANRSDSDLGYLTGQKYVSRFSELTNTAGASHISYYQTVVLGVDEQGKLLWDQSLSLGETKTLALEQVAEFCKNDEGGMLFYKRDNEIVFRSFSLDQKSVDSAIAINTFREFDEVNSHSEQQGRVQHWYENYFIVWGYQKINNQQSTQVSKKRNIFFINKLLAN